MKKDNKNKTSFGFKEVDSDEKANLVGNVFDTVSENYDLMNDLMSFGIHRLWKKVTIETSGIKENFKVLDLAGGTGDMIKLMRDKVSPEKTVLKNLPSAYPRLATALIDISGTVFPNTVWKTIKSSRGLSFNPQFFANSFEDWRANLVG